MSDSEIPAIAIIGMSGRFPGAPDLAAYWRNLCAGVESISHFSDDQLRAGGDDPARIAAPGYVKAKGVLAGADLFDAEFFGFSPRDAQVLDPQQRAFLESAWETIESAGYDPYRYPGAIGVYGGVSRNTYWPNNLARCADIAGVVSTFQILLGNDKDFAATRVSYKLNLTGPSLTIQTACSTSLVAVAVACEALVAYQCDMALAGGASIKVPQASGYVYQEGGIGSPDGHCRPFDHRAQGTVGGSGVGTVLLKRLDDALADGDHIRAVTRGWAINNDGSLKVGYTAPSLDGQAEVISAAYMSAGIDPRTLGYVEAHGTATPLGDPIEIAALTLAFGEAPFEPGACAIGSVKSNIGHLDVAAGVAGLIKTVLALEAGVIPPSLHFEQPNPQIDFAASPFHVSTGLREWRTGSPRRAGVSSFGIGGTNAHVVLEQAPERAARAANASENPGPIDSPELLVLSARTTGALDTMTDQLAAHLADRPGLPLADVGHTLQVGRCEFRHRRAVVASGTEAAAAALIANQPGRVVTAVAREDGLKVIFMFPGQGAQQVGMGAGLYRRAPVFRQVLDECAEGLVPNLGLDIRKLLYPAGADAEPARRRLDDTRFTQPALFAVEYALAKLWEDLGVHPAAVVGHSIGEYVAACLAGVFSLADGLALVAARGRLIGELPRGAMLGVTLPEAELAPLLPPGVALAATNAGSLTVASGETTAIQRLGDELDARGVPATPLRTSHAFHSPMMDGCLEEFRKCVEGTPLNPPQLSFVSTVTGELITPDQATDPGYWVAQLRNPVRFSQAVTTARQDDGTILLEVGPGRTLSALADLQAADGERGLALSSLGRGHSGDAFTAFLAAAGGLWASGHSIRWDRLHDGRPRRRVPLPTYPFERRRHWAEPNARAARATAAGPKRPDVGDWFYAPSWRRLTAIDEAATGPRASWLVLTDEAGLGRALCAELVSAGHHVTTVARGDRFSVTAPGSYQLRPTARTDYDALLTALRTEGPMPRRVVHLWGLDAPADRDVATQRELSFFSLVVLAQSLGEFSSEELIELDVVTQGLHEVVGGESLRRAAAGALGVCRVIPREYPTLVCRQIDVGATVSPVAVSTDLVRSLAEELTAPDRVTVVALRGQMRWTESFDPVRVRSRPAPGGDQPGRRIRAGGVYLITGGLGRIGLVVAELLAQQASCRLVLIGRSPFPPREEWEHWLSSHPAADPTSARIRRLLALQASGSTVTVWSADVSDRPAMARLIGEVRSRYGAITGVLHAAGLTSGESFRPLQWIERDQLEAHLRPKVDGLAVLEELLCHEPLELFVLFSSLSSVLGGTGFAGYCAANISLDITALDNWRRGRREWLSIAWDGWASGPDENGSGISPYAMTSAEGAEVLRRALQYPGAQLVVSTGDLAARIAQRSRLAARLRVAPTVVAASTANGMPIAGDLRPDLGRTPVPPRNDRQRVITSIWEQLLGIRGIGIDDDFFELGGHSLLATQLIFRVRQALHVNVPLAALFEGPTIAALTAAVDTAEAGLGSVDQPGPIPNRAARLARGGA
jgi:acyl transferase domain-containing protein/acyl carrier protein